MNVSSSEDDPLIKTTRQGAGSPSLSWSTRQGRRRVLWYAVFAVMGIATAYFYVGWFGGRRRGNDQQEEDDTARHNSQALKKQSAEALLLQNEETAASSIVYRPFCEYWSAEDDNDDDDKQRHAVFQEGIESSMTHPSQPWSQVGCIPIHGDDEEDDDDDDESAKSSSRFGFWNTLKRKQPSSPPPPPPKSPLSTNQYQAPDAILQVDFSRIAFSNRPPIHGFGGAFTEASALNYNRLSERGKEAVMELLFGKTGLGYAIGRIPMNSCDFSIASYSFDDVNDDFDLQHFDMGVQHDVESGMVDMALRAVSVLKQSWSNDWNDNDGILRLMASPWSPPSWMKTPTERDAEGAEHAGDMLFSAMPVCLRQGVGPESPYAKAWALYFSKFVTAYANLGLPLWAVTVQNEPEFPAPWEACAFTPQTETDFVANHLGPRLAQDHPDLNLFVFDHNKDHINEWTDMLLNQTLGARQYVNGIAYHWYAGGMDRLLDGALGIPNMHRLQENLKGQAQEQQLLVGSESCHCPTTGYAGGDIRVAFDRAERYAHTILADLAAGSNGWTEWNLILDSIGGPNHLGNLCETGLLAVPHRAVHAGGLDIVPPLPPFEQNHPFGNVNIGDGRTREELDALGFPAKYLDVGVVVQPIYYYMGHISRYVRPGSYAVSGLITSSPASRGTISEGRIFRPKGSVVAGGGENNLARQGIEITLWPCEGSTRQMFAWEFEQHKHIAVHGHDWLGHPTKSCIANEVDPEFRGLRLTDCDQPSAGVFDVLPLISDSTGQETRQYKIMLLNHPSTASSQCLAIQKLANDGGAYGPRGGAQVILSDCDDATNESTKWFINAQFGEASSLFFGDDQEVCMTTGWPFLQMGAFVTPPGDQKTVVLLNEANQAANFAIKNQDDLVLAASIPGRSIQTYVFK